MALPDKSNQTVIIKALSIKKLKNKAVLQHHNVFNLEAQPNLPILGTHKTLSSFPKAGDIVVIKTRFGLKNLVVVDDRPSGLGPHTRVKPIVAVLGVHLMDRNLVYDFNTYTSFHHLNVPDVKPEMIVVQGYHYGFKNKKPYVNTTKEYNFRVTNLSNHVEWMAKDRTASVLTRRGKSLLVIANILYPKGSIAVQAASRLMPVISFHNYGIRNKWINKLYHVIMKKRHAANAK